MMKKELMTMKPISMATSKDLNEIERINLYLGMHPEVFTEEFMAENAQKYHNYYNVRKYIKDNWHKITNELIDNITIIPRDEKEIKKLLKTKVQ